MRNSAILLCAALALSAASLHAENWGKYKTREEAIEGHRRNVESVGGLVERPQIGPHVLFIDEQSAIGAAAVDEKVANLTGKMRIRNKVVRGSGLPQPSVLHTNYLADAEVAAAISICDLGPDAPALAIYPELRAAAVNVAALKVGAENDPGLQAERLRKELWRAFGFVFGGCYTVQYPKAALRPISSLTELDRSECVAISIDSMQPINKVMERWGMSPVKKTSYKRAAEEGWAPAPTNDVQRALWEAAEADRKAKAESAGEDGKAASQDTGTGDKAHMAAEGE